MTAEPNSSPLYGRLERHSASSGSLVIAFLWGLAEATLFFVVPDVYVGFVALFHWRKGLLTTVAATAGAMIGGAIMYGLAGANAPAINELLVEVPLISPEMVRTVAGQTQTSGLVAMVTGPLQGIPYKIYAAQAGQQYLPFISFVLVTIVARLPRFFLLALMGAGLGRVFGKSVRRRTALVVGAYVLLWIGVYVWYYFKVG